MACAIWEGMAAPSRSLGGSGGAGLPVGSGAVDIWRGPGNACWSFTLTWRQPGVQGFLGRVLGGLCAGGIASAGRAGERRNANSAKGRKQRKQRKQFRSGGGATITNRARPRVLQVVGAGTKALLPGRQKPFLRC